MVPDVRSTRPKAVRSVGRGAGRQAQLDPAAGDAGKATDDRAGEHVRLGGIGNDRTRCGPCKPARCRVLQATGKRSGQQDEKDK